MPVSASSFLREGKDAEEFRALPRKELDEIHRPFGFRKPLDTGRQFAKGLRVVGWGIEDADSEAWLET
jgi:hypothetical protein